jgi:hypothetical protein
LRLLFRYSFELSVERFPKLAQSRSASEFYFAQLEAFAFRSDLERVLEQDLSEWELMV